MKLPAALDLAVTAFGARSPIASARLSWRAARTHAAAAWCALIAGVALLAVSRLSVPWQIFSGGRPTAGEGFNGVLLLVAAAAIPIALWRLTHELRAGGHEGRREREQQELLRDVFDTVQAALLVTDNHENIVLANRTAASLLGYTIEELERVKPIEFVHPDEREAILKRSRARLRGIPSSPQFRRRMVRKDGSSVWVEATPTTLEIDGKVAGRVTEYREITAKVEAERGIRERDLRLEALLSSASMTLLHVDRDRVIRSTLGSLPSGVPARGPDEIGHTIDACYGDDPERIARMERALAGASFSEKIQIGPATVLGTFTSLRDDGGAPNGFVVVAVDVTEHETAEVALIQSETRLTQAQRMARLGWWEWYPRSGSGIIIWSDDVYRMFGREPGSVDARRAFEEGVHPEDREQQRRLVRRAWERGETYEIDHRIVLPDGTERTVHQSAEVVLGADGEPSHMAGTIQDVTERVQGERALRESEERARTLLETVRSGIVVISMERRMLTVNEAACEMFGYAREELLGLLIDDVVVPEDAVEMRERFTMRQAGEAMPEWVRVQAQRRDGSNFELEVRVTSLVHDGAPAVLAELRDITEELALQRAIASTAAEVSSILDTAPDAIVLMDEGGTIVRANPAVREIFGWEPEELEQQPVSTLVGGGDRDMHDRYLQRYLESGQASTPQGLVIGRMRGATGRRKDGTEFPVELSIAEVAGSAGPRMFTAVLRDVSERRAAERALRESEERNRVIVDAIATPLTVWDPQNRLLHHNQALRELTGYSAEELASMTPEELLRDEGAPAIAEDAAAVRRGERPATRVCELRRADGEARSVALTMAAIEFPGEPDALLVQTVDVTAQLEAELRLRQSQRLEAIGTLVSGVAHDFNNLLTAIGGSIELALTDPDPRPWLERGKVATDRASDLVQQLLRISRRTPRQPSIVDLKELVTETVDLVRQTTDRRVAFELEIEDSVRAWGDPSELQQVVMNLLVNARDAVLERLEAEQPEPRLFHPVVTTVVLRDIPAAEGAASESCAVQIRDNGAGMSTEVRERIFDPFFTTKSVDKGTGLGMSTVHAIVSDLGGEVNVESTLGEGTTVTVTFPAVVDLGDQGRDEQAATALPGGESKRVLIVDDEPTIARFASSVLEASGYQTLHVTEGAAALTEVRRERYDLVLLDVNMPALSGWEVLNELLSVRADQAVVMISGYALEREAIERGARGLVQKPFNGAVLRQAVADALLRRAD